MTFLDRWRTAKAVATREEPVGATFDSSGVVVTGEFFPWMTSDSDAVTPVARVSRSEAIQCAAVKRVRDIIAGTIGGLPLNYLDGENRASRSALLEQPEAAIPRSVTMTRLVEDLLFEGYGWWRVVSRDWRGYPAKVVRLDPLSVTIDDEQKVWVRSDGRSQGSSWQVIEDRDVIRFYSPNDPLLAAGARAIRTALRLSAAADRYSETPTPTGYFEPREGADPIDDEDVTDLLDNWSTARRARSTAYVPAALKYNPVQWSPVELGLNDRLQNAVLEIARIGGVDPEDLGVSTTSRTYQNGDSRQRALVDMTLSGYMQAVQDRLSMGDVTPRGYTARFDLNGFLRSNEDQRVDTYTKAVELGLYDVEAAQRREELPPFRKPVEEAPTAPVRPLRAIPAQEQSVAASADAGLTFDEALAVGFEAPEGAAFDVDLERRMIYGLAVPWGAVASSQGRRFTFSRGSLQWRDVRRVKFLVGHDRSQAIGRAVELTEDARGLWAKLWVAPGAAGDRVLALAQDGVLDGLSIGLGDPALGHFEAVSAAPGAALVQRCVSAPLAEISITPLPAFSDARISSVAASADTITMEGPPMTGAPGTDIATPAEPVTSPAIDYAALAAAIAPHLAPPPPAAVALEADQTPEVIPAAGGGTAPMFVDEESPYRFEAERGFVTGGSHDFSGDLRAAHNGDHQAYLRVLDFMGAALTFDTDTTDAAGLNPSRQRPDKYVGLRQYKYPLWNRVRKEGLSDITPMVLPKYSSHSGLVAAHTQATEPAVGAAAWTTQIITPGAVSGKVEITRELWDQGGNPRVSNKIWELMVDGWFEALEAKVVTVLDAASPTGITLTTAAEDGDLSVNIANEWAALQFIRGGFDFDTFAVQIDLYKRLASAATDEGEPLFPMLNPSNRNGTSASRFASMDVHGVDAFPSWALAATGAVAASSYLFDDDSVYGAASAPERLEWNFGATVQTANIPQLSHVTLGIWGYSVVAITDLTGVREVIYDPTA